MIGNGPVSYKSRERESIVLGTTAAFFDIRQMQVGQGSSLPELALNEGTPVAVIGHKLKSELFDNRRAIGQWVRLRDYRFRVIGVLQGTGDSFGADLSEAIFVPVASAQSVFNVHGLFRVMMKVKDNYQVEEVKSQISHRMQELHDGEQDVPIVSPDAMLSTFDDILQAMTLGVAGIAAISLVVAGILVMNVTLMSVKQRTAEIGLLKAVGAPAAQVRTLFLTEAALIASAGALLGMLLGTCWSQLAGSCTRQCPLPRRPGRCGPPRPGGWHRAAVRLAARPAGGQHGTRRCAGQEVNRHVTE